MSDPFRIDGPAVISFSGGLTSAYMLRRILDVGLQSDVHVIFANTGRERSETLDFVRDCASAWCVDVHWVEYGGRTADGHVVEREYVTASRHGEPFSNIIQARSYLPNPVTRFCTTELKIRPMRNWMRAHGYDDGAWTNVVGLRADEPRRVARLRGKNNEGQWDVALPLADAGVTLVDVRAFWASQPFTLNLQPHEGNCDLCFLKGYAKLKNIVRDRPDLAEWWAQQEELAGKTFRIDRPSYRAMLNQPDLFAAPTDDLIECYCTD